jgi:zinc protease
MVGDFSTAEVLPRIRAAYGKIPRGAEPPKLTLVEPPQRGEKRIVLKKEAELPLLMMFFHAPNLHNPDSFALDLLSVVLAGGKSSRLYQELVYRKRSVRGIDADYSNVSIDATGFSISAQLLPGAELAGVERQIESQLDKVKTELVNERELQKAKNQIEAAFIFAQDSIFGQAMKIGYYEMVGDWRLVDSYLANVRKVTREDLRRVAQKYLQRDNRTVGTLIPTKAKTQ